MANLDASSSIEEVSSEVPSMKAPNFPSDALWLNVDPPLTWEVLQGRVVLLHFFTYC